MRNLIILGVAILTLGSCCFFGEAVQGDGRIITRDYYVGTFDEIELASIGRVIVTQGTNEEVTAIGDRNILERITIERNGDCLVVEQDYGVNLQPSQELIFLITIENVERLHLSGAGSIVSNSQICADRIRLIVEGAGDIELDIHANEVVSIISGAGDITLEGSAPLAEYLIDGVGNVRAYNLISNDVEAVISGVGDIRVTAKENLQAVIDGVGNVTYDGNPIVNARVDGAGSVRSR